MMLVGAKAYEPLSENDLKKAEINLVLDRLCFAIGKSIYYYQHLIKVVQDYISLKSSNKSDIKVFLALLYETNDKTLFSIFKKLYPCKSHGILEKLSDIRNNIVHSNYFVGQYNTLVEKPRLDKANNSELVKKNMNLDANNIMLFSELLMVTIGILLEKRVEMMTNKLTEEDKNNIDIKLFEIKIKIDELNTDINKEKYKSLIKALKIQDR